MWPMWVKCWMGGVVVAYIVCGLCGVGFCMLCRWVWLWLWYGLVIEFLGCKWFRLL